MLCAGMLELMCYVVVCCGCSVGAEEAKSSVEIKQVAVKSVDSNIALIRASKEVCVRLWNVRVFQCLCACACACACACLLCTRACCFLAVAYVCVMWVCCDCVSAYTLPLHSRSVFLWLVESGSQLQASTSRMSGAGSLYMAAMGSRPLLHGTWRSRLLRSWAE